MRDAPETTTEGNRTVPNNDLHNRLKYHVSGAIERGEGEAITERIALTDEGLTYAASVMDTSMVARVAIAGYGQGWPDDHVSAAIRACNKS